MLEMLRDYFKPGEMHAIEMGLEARVFDLERRIKHWTEKGDEKQVEQCEIFLKETEDALAKVKG